MVVNLVRVVQDLCMELLGASDFPAWSRTKAERYVMPYPQVISYRRSAYIRSGGAEHVPANIAASSQRVHAGLHSHVGGTHP